MNSLNISDNIAALRREKNITQEELADFVGVTKASVSKWEKGQSMPDILLLPRLAAFFDITVDELIGYEPKLSKEQIQRIYGELAEAFAKQPFDEVMGKVRDMVKRYYSCYPFLHQVCILMINHMEKAGNMHELLMEGVELCDHIIASCKETKIINNTIVIKAMYELQLGNADAVIETLENLYDPTGVTYQSDGLLAHAYMIKGDMDKAESYTQINIYLHMCSVISASIQHISLNMANMDICKETMKRTEGMLQLYKLDKLHPNTAAQYYYQAAIVYTTYGEFDEAVKSLDKYADCAFELLQEDNFHLHGDEYFNRLDEWIDKLELGAMPVRDRKSVISDVLASIEMEMFAPLKDNPKYKLIQIKLKEGLK